MSSRRRCLQRLESEHVTDQRGQHVDDRTLFEQVDRVGDEGVERLGVARHVFDAVSAALVVLEIGQEFGPDRTPGAGRRFGGHGGGDLFTRHFRLARAL